MTTWETVIGFVIAAVVGELVAVVMVYSSSLEKTLYPLILFAQVVPKIAIAPLFIVWLGFGPTPKILVAVLMAFFPIVISGLAGLRSVDPEILELTSTMGASKFKTFLKIRFPASLPQLMSGLKVAATLAVTGAVVGEFVGANEGLGYVILQANGNVDTAMLFAALIIMSRPRDRAFRDHRDRREAAHSVALVAAYHLNSQPPPPPDPNRRSPKNQELEMTFFTKPRDRHGSRCRDRTGAVRLWRRRSIRKRPCRRRFHHRVDADAQLVSVRRARAVLLRSAGGHLRQARHRPEDRCRPGLHQDGPGVGSEQADFGWADTPAVLSNIDKGVEVKSVGVFLQTTPSAVQVFADSGINTPQDLAGRTIAVSAGDAPTTTFPIYLDKVGVPEDQVTQQSLDAAGKMSAMMSDRVDGLIGFAHDQGPTIANKSGREVRYLRYSDAGLNFYSNGLIVNTATIENSPDLVQAMVDATSEAYAAAADESGGRGRCDGR